MGKPSKSMPWFPMYPNKWLWGSTREELTHEERAIFSDFLCLAAQNGGYIAANLDDEIPYSIPRLSKLLDAEVELIERTIKKCITAGKLKQLESGIFQVLSWEEYQLSERYVRRLKCSSAKVEHSTGKPEHSSKKAVPIGEERRGEERERKREKRDGEAKASQRKPYYFWTDEEIGNVGTVDQCQALWDRCYFRLTTHTPVRDYARDGNLFKKMLAAKWPLGQLIREFFKEVEERDEELGGYTVGVFKAWVARRDAEAIRLKREEAARRMR